MKSAQKTNQPVDSDEVSAMFEREEGEEWIINRISGLAHLVDDYRDESPHSAIERIYNRASSKARMYLSSVILRILKKSIGDDDYNLCLSDQALVELFFLAGSVVGIYPERMPVIKELAQFLDSDRVIHNCELRRSVFRTLAALHHNMAPRYYKDIYSKYGDRYFSIAFEGIAREDLFTAFNWLLDIDITQEIENIVSMYVPYLIRRYGLGDFLRELSVVIAEFSPGFRRLINDVANAEGFDIDVISNHKTEELQIIEKQIIAKTLLPFLDELLSDTQLDIFRKPSKTLSFSLREILNALDDWYLGAASYRCQDAGDSFYSLYASCLQKTLLIPEFSIDSYKILIRHLPLPETVEITREIISNGILSIKDVESCLSNQYSIDEVTLIAGDSAEHSFGTKTLDTFSLDVDLKESIEDVFISGGFVGDSVRNLTCLDSLTPKSEEQWVKKIGSLFQTN